MDQNELLRLLEAATHQPGSSLHFTPVRLRARRDGWSEARQRRFIAALAYTGSAAAAADRVGMTEQTANRLTRRPDGASFSTACSAAYTLAKQARRANAAAARAEAADGAQGAKGSARHFAPMPAALSTSAEPSGATTEPFAPRRHGPVADAGPREFAPGSAAGRRRWHV